MPPFHYFFDDVTRVALFLGMLVALLGTLIAGLNWYAKADTAWHADVKLADDQRASAAAAAQLKAAEDVNYAEEKATIAAKTAADNSEIDKAIEERRRLKVLDDLRQQYIFTNDGISTELMIGQAWPPEDWINAQLKKKGEQWTVSTQGPKIYWSQYIPSQ